MNNTSEAADRNARNCIMFYYERITGTNLYGTFPHPTAWRTPAYSAALEKAILNLSQARKEEEIRIIYQKYIA